MQIMHSTAYLLYICVYIFLCRKLSDYIVDSMSPAA